MFNSGVSQLKSQPQIPTPNLAGSDFQFGRLAAPRYGRFQRGSPLRVFSHASLGQELQDGASDGRRYSARRQKVLAQRIHPSERSDEAGWGGAGGCAARLDALVDSPCRPLSTPILTLTLNPQLSPPTPTPNSHPQLSPLTPTFSHSPRWRSSPLASVCSISAARPNRAAPTPLTASSSSASHL